MCVARNVIESRYTEQIFSEKDACSAGDLTSLLYVEVYVLARVVISGVYPYIIRVSTEKFLGPCRISINSIQNLSASSLVNKFR